MKKIKLLSISGILFFTSFQLKAQVPLPYSTGFDNTSEQNGWVEYKTAATQHSHWNYGSANSYSTPNSVGHDYSPSTGITLTDNWFVSPGFSITSGGQLDSIRYSFSGFSTPDAGDTVAIYLLNGSQDPSAATSKTLLFDFRGTEYITDNVYRIKTGINLPSLNGLSYLALRYRNTDCSSKWLTAKFDNIAISENPVGVNENQLDANKINIYPNPSTGKFIVKSIKNIEAITIQNAIGLTVYQSAQLKGSNIAEIDLSDKQLGSYTVSIDHGKTITTKKLIITH